MKVLDGHGIMFVEHGLLKNLDTVNFIMDIKQVTLTSKATTSKTSTCQIHR